MNKKHIISITLFTVIVGIIQGQSQIQGRIVDSETKDPLPYVIVAIPKQQYGTYSDSLGTFKLKYLNKTDSVKIIHMGYNTLYTSIETLETNAQVLLVAKPVQLNQIIIQPGKKKSTVLELGRFVRKPDSNLVPSYQVNQEAIFIPFPKDGDNVIIKSLQFIYCNSLTNNYPLRIRILKPTMDGNPGEDLISENIIFLNEKSRFNSVCKLDLRRFNLHMPKEGLFVMLEWIGFDRSNLKLNDKGQVDPWSNQFGPGLGIMRIPSQKWVNFYESQGWTKFNIQFTYCIGLTVINHTNQ